MCNRHLCNIHMLNIHLCNVHVWNILLCNYTPASKDLVGCWISLSLSGCCFLWEISMLRSPLHSFMKKHFDKYLCQLIRSLCWTILSEAPSQPIKGKKRKWVPIHMLNFIELKTLKLPIKISTTLKFKYRVHKILERRKLNYIF